MKIHAMELESKKIEDLILDDKNPRLHSDQQIDQLAKGIKAMGFTAPVLIDESNNVLAGHGRLLAAKKVGMKTVPVRVLVGLSDQEKRAYRLLDNRIGELASWDYQLLQEELMALQQQEEMALGEIGFDEKLLTFAKRMAQEVEEVAGVAVEKVVMCECEKCGDLHVKPTASD